MGGMGCISTQKAPAFAGLRVNSLDVFGASERSSWRRVGIRTYADQFPRMSALQDIFHMVPSVVSKFRPQTSDVATTSPLARPFQHCRAAHGGEEARTLSFQTA
jgi:hypothetical protein